MQMKRKMSLTSSTQWVNSLIKIWALLSEVSTNLISTLLWQVILNQQWQDLLFKSSFKQLSNLWPLSRKCKQENRQKLRDERKSWDKQHTGQSTTMHRLNSLSSPMHMTLWRQTIKLSLMQANYRTRRTFLCRLRAKPSSNHLTLRH